MDFVSLVITFLLAGLMLLLVVRLPLAILSNLRAGHRFREGLADALAELRLSRMLKYLDIDAATYLHKEQAVEIRKHMERCDACDAKSRCDQVVGNEPAADAEHLGFCANIEDLKEIRRVR